MAAELTDYITKAREKHFSDEEIQNKLVTSGWPKEQVSVALSQKNELPAPPPPPINGHADVLYLLFFISLYILAFSIGGIFYLWIDKVTATAQTLASVPTTDTGINPCFYGTGEFGPLCSLSPISPFNLATDVASLARGYIAAIIVSYPIFVILTIVLKKQLAKQPLLKNLRTRKILIYITVIISFLIMISTVIAAWYNFLAGSLHEDMIRHTIIILLIAGSLFSYFLSEVKNEKNIV